MTMRTMWNPPRSERFLPSRGHAIVTITVVDENGFTHHYAPVEARRDILAQALAVLSPDTQDVDHPGRALRAPRRNRW